MSRLLRRGLPWALVGLLAVLGQPAWGADEAKKGEESKSARAPQATAEEDGKGGKSAKAAEEGSRAGKSAKASAEDEAKDAKDAKSARSAKGGGEEIRPIRGVKGVDESKAAKTAKSGSEESKAGKSAKAIVEEDAKAGKTARAPVEAKAGRAGKSGEEEESERLDRLGAKVNQTFAKAKESKNASPGSLTIRLSSPAGGAAGHGARSTASRAQSPAAQAQAAALAHRASLTAQGHHAHWSYSGETGPEHWARMKPEYAKCVEGMRQSPINIRGGVKVDLEPIQFDYRPSPYAVIDNGHTVQVNLSGGNAISVMGRRYELQQFHFHRPAEERVDGRTFDMVAHLVHKDPEGRLAVVAVLMDRGRANTMIQSVWNDLPLERNEEMRGSSQIDLNDLLPLGRGYYTYMGSLTTPPCTEGVLWLVMKEPVTVSPEQIAIFSRLHPMNARPLQSIGGRLIKESN